MSRRIHRTTKKKKESRVSNTHETQPSRCNATELLKQSDHAARLRSTAGSVTRVCARSRARSSRPYSALFNHCMRFLLSSTTATTFVDGCRSAPTRGLRPRAFTPLSHYSRKCNGNVRDIITFAAVSCTVAKCCVKIEDSTFSLSQCTKFLQKKLNLLIEHL